MANIDDEQFQAIVQMFIFSYVIRVLYDSAEREMGQGLIAERPAGSDHKTVQEERYGLAL